MRRIIVFVSFLLALTLLLSACSTAVPSSMVFVPLNQPEQMAARPASVTDAPETPAGETTDAPSPAPEPTDALTQAPTEAPSEVPTEQPTSAPTQVPTAVPTSTPLVTQAPTAVPTPSNASSGGKYIYLTFDDGPCANTLRVIEILNRYGVKATFFTVGYFVDRNPDIAREIVSSGNLIACHSYTHDFNQCYASAEAMMNEVERWEQAVTNAVGHLPWRLCFRFPGGSRTASAKPIRERIISLLRQRGYMWFDWNAGNNDKWAAGNTENLPFMQYLIKSYRSTMSYHERNGTSHVVFLCHDTVNETVEMLPMMLEELLAKGYEFRVLSQHPKWNE